MSIEKLQKIITLVIVIGALSVPVFLIARTAFSSCVSNNGTESVSTPKEPGKTGSSGSDAEVILPTATPTPTPSPSPTPTPIVVNNVYNINETDAGLTAELDAVASSYYCVAATVAAFDPAEGFFTYQYGVTDISDKTPVEEDTKFRVASLSKLIVGILAMRLVDDGVLDLDEDISIYFGYDVRNPNYSDTPITCRMLLQHTASYSDYGEYNSGEIAFNSGTLKSLITRGTGYSGSRPGSRRDYSNLGYVVLAGVCESVSGKMLDTLADDLLFEPLGITAAFSPFYLTGHSIASQYDIDRNLRQSGFTASNTANPADRGFQHNSAPGNLRISAIDYARILYMLTNGGLAHNDVRILSEDAVAEMENADIAANEFFKQGLCLWYQENGFLGRDVYWHTGSAYGTFAQFLYDAETGRIVVVVTTGGSGAREDNNMVKSCLAFAKLVW